MDNVNNILNMEDISKGIIPSNKNLEEDTKLQLRLFLIAQAKRELERVVKLTNVLDKLQDKYESKVCSYIEEHNDDTSLVYLPTMIDTITKCLSRSNDIINQIVGNDKIMNFTFINDNSTMNVGNNKIDVNLKDPVSRMKVREAVNLILSNVENIE